MDRRSFLKIGGTFFAIGVGCKFDSPTKESNFGITVDSNRNIGHLARNAVSQAISQNLTTDVLIVGGGIAGLAAASSLKGRAFLLCEMNPKLGGTSSAVNIGGTQFSQGAHYDLSYPGYYGKESLSLLERLDIIKWNGRNNRWDFVEKKYLIDPKNEERCFSNGVFMESVLPNSELKQNMIDLLKPYIGKMLLPTTQIGVEMHWLDKLSFYAYLEKYLPITDEFIESIDYQMLDDFGGTSREVSAMAGIHYYTCRPYFSKPEPELFSPPEGNYYFINKMARSLPKESIKTNYLVVATSKQSNHWLTDVWNVQEKRKIRIKSKNIIYAGQKHLLQYLYPKAYSQFKDVTYTPWVVVNIELNGEVITSNFWQNDYLSPNGQFLGFVNSNTQYSNGNRVLSAYYCYPSVYHYMVQEIETDPKKIVDETIGYLSTYYNQDLTKYVKHAYVKLLGHAMPIPAPGFLTKQRASLVDGMSFAGVDSGRLPLMFDAMDSGIQAANVLSET